MSRPNPTEYVGRTWILGLAITVLLTGSGWGAEHRTGALLDRVHRLQARVAANKDDLRAQRDLQKALEQLPKANPSSSASKRLALFEALPAGVTHRFGLWEVYIGTWKGCEFCSEEAALIVSAIDDDRRVILPELSEYAFLRVEGEGYYLFLTNGCSLAFTQRFLRFL